MAFLKFNLAGLALASILLPSCLTAEPLSGETAIALAARGSPASESFYAKETGVHGSVNELATLPSGELAILTTQGLYLFDGTNWTSIPGVPWATGLKNSPSGVTTLSTSHGLYQITPQGTGDYATKKLAATEYDIQPLPAIEHLAFAHDRVFGLVGDRLITIAPDDSLHLHQLEDWASGLFTIEGELYIMGGGESALNRWNWETGTLVNAAQSLQNAGNYDWMLKSTPRAQGGVWILTETNEIIGFDGTSNYDWPGNAQLPSRNIKVRDFVEIAPDTLAIASTNQGLYLFDENATLTLHYDAEQGLVDNRIQHLATDSQNGLWIATENCLSRLQLDFESALFDERHGIESMVKSIAYFQDRIYLGASEGLYVSQLDLSSTAFTLELEQNEITDLLVHQGNLFIAGSTLTIISPEGETYQLPVHRATTFLAPSAYPDLLLASTLEGIALLAKQNNRWTLHNWLEGPSIDAYSLTETSDGSFIAALGDNRIARIHLTPTGGSYQLETFPGFQTGDWTVLASIKGKTYLSGRPCQIWDTASASFVPDKEMEFYLGTPPFGFDQIMGPNINEVYVPRNTRSSDYLPRPAIQTIREISILKNDIDNRATSLAYDANGDTWSAGSFGLLFSKAPRNRNHPANLAPKFHTITSLSDNQALSLTPSPEPHHLKANQNNLKVVATYPNFRNSKHQQFQILLDDQSPISTPFTQTNWREFANLSPGLHSLKINALDTSGAVKSSPVFTFQIAAPWYQSPFTNLLYLCAAGLIVTAIVQIKTRAQAKRNHRLEQLVKLRTRELHLKNTELGSQARDLANTLHQLQETQTQLVSTARTAGKAEIAINVLHNVGNILNSLNVSLNTLSHRASYSNATKLTRLSTLITSNRENIDVYLSSDPKGKQIPEYFTLLSQSLSAEIESNQIELAKMHEQLTHLKTIIKAQQIHAKTAHSKENILVQNLIQSALNIVTNTHADSQAEIDTDIPPDLVIETDKHLCLDILVNLLGNAHDSIQQKTPAIGSIQISATATPQTNTVAIQITDNGKGIQPEHINNLFQHGFTTKPHGHGFGLHASSNAARTLGGHLQLVSPGPGLGATATLNLPQKP